MRQKDELAALMAFYYHNGTERGGLPTTFRSVITAIDMVDSSLGWGVTYQGQLIRYDGSFGSRYPVYLPLISKTF